MYYNYFGLAEAPFSIAPNPEYLFMTDRHQEALAHLYHSVESEAGFVLLTGDVGTGKTTVCRSFLDNLPEDTDIAFILNPFLGGKELLRTICQELHIDNVPNKATLRESTEAIYRHLLHNHSLGKQTVLLIDEAQHLHFKVLELIRLLTNLETNTQKLLKVILVGQPELNDTLDKPELSQLSQRITARYHIHPLSFDETGSYIDYRLRMAGYMNDKKLFPPAVVKQVYSVTKGVPRLINVICDRALLGAYSQNRAAVDKAILKRAVLEVRGEHHLKTPRYRYWLAAGVGGILLVGALAISQFTGVIGAEQPSSVQTHSALASESTVVDKQNLEKKNLEKKSPDKQHADKKELTKEGVEQNAVEQQAIETNNPGTVGLEKITPEQADVSTVLESQTQQQSQAQAPVSVLNDESTVAVTSQTEAQPTPVESKPEPPSVGALNQRAAQSITRPAAHYKSFTAAMAKLIPSTNTVLAGKNQTYNCEQLVQIGWQCRQKTAGWETLSRYNRPAVLTLNNGSESYYIAVTGISDGFVQILGSDTNQVIAKEDIINKWTGQFTYLWQPPERFVDYIFFGSNQELVDWLAKAFASIDNREEQLASTQFNSLLKQRVILFQRENGLVEDGIAGIETLLKLNEKTGVAVTLTQDVSAAAQTSTPGSVTN